VVKRYDRDGGRPHDAACHARTVGHDAEVSGLRQIYSSLWLNSLWLGLRPSSLSPLTPSERLRRPSLLSWAMLDSLLLDSSSYVR
jgi:hypothetical protein